MSAPANAATPELPEERRIKILLVYDTPENLVSLEAALGDL